MAEPEKKKKKETKAPNQVSIRAKKNELIEAGAENGEINWDPDSFTKENPYYSTIAVRYRNAKLVFLGILVVYLIFMITAFREQITVENLRYLLKDMNLSSLVRVSDYDTIVYENSADSRFALFKGDLVVVREGTTSIFNKTGSLVFSETNNNYSPRLLTSSKYILVYDMGDSSNTYTIYNAFSALKTEKFEYPITAGAVSDSGMYALATKDAKYRGIVCIYNADFELISRISKYKYIMDLTFNDDASNLLILSAFDENGGWNGEIMACDPKSDNAVFTINLDGEMPYKAVYNKEGGFTVLTDSALRFYNADGSLISLVSFGTQVPTNCNLYRDYSLLAYNKNVLGNDHILVVCNREGKEIYRDIRSGQLRDTLFDTDYFYYLFEDKLVRVAMSGMADTLEIEGNCLDILSVEPGKVMLCYSGSAYLADFENK